MAADMLSPSFVLSLLIGSLWGLGFFLLFGQGSGKITTYWVVGMVAFLAGQLFAAYYPLTSTVIGEVHPVEGSVASLLGLLVARWAKT